MTHQAPCSVVVCFCFSPRVACFCADGRTDIVCKYNDHLYRAGVWWVKKTSDLGSSYFFMFNKSLKIKADMLFSLAIMSMIQQILFDPLGR